MGDAQPAYFLGQNGSSSVDRLTVNLAACVQASLVNAFLDDEPVDFSHNSARCRIVVTAAIGTLASGLVGRLFDSSISM
jgi:hypothetical protein